jgi:hypothetical protein
MKKLIAIAVIFALAAVSVSFAETTLGGQIFIGGEFLNGNNVEKSQPGTGAVAVDSNTKVKVGFGDSTAGGFLNFKASTWHQWFGFWKPIDSLRIKVGSDEDGDFGAAQITGWGFTGEAKNGLGALSDYGSYNTIGGLTVARGGFYGGTGSTPNVNLSYNPPVDGLQVNFWIPFQGQNAGATYSKFELQVVYKIPDIGTAYLSYQNRAGYLRGTADSWWGNNAYTETPKIWASFYLTAIDNMAVDLGVAYHFPLTNQGKLQEGEKEKVLNYPVDIGLGFRFASGDFTFKLRAGFSFGESATYDGKEVEAISDEAQTKVGVNILPSYKVGNVTVFFFAGLGIDAVQDYKKAGGKWATNESNSVASWFVNPYVHIPAGDALRFQVGFQLYSDGVKDTVLKAGDDPAPLVKWAIPFGFYAYF